MAIIQNFLINNDCYNFSTVMHQNPKGIMLHSVGCAQDKASVFLRLWNTPGVQIGVHGIIDGVTGDCYQCLKWKWQGWHAGGSANADYIGIEMCEPSQIIYDGYSDRFIIQPYDLDVARETVSKCYVGAVSAFAHLCLDFNLDPLGDSVILSHSEGHKKGIASGHTDPEHLWKGLGCSYTMNGFRHDVKIVLDHLKDKKDNYIYRIQCGAFTQKHYAEDYLRRVKQAGFDDAFILESRLN